METIIILCDEQTYMAIKCLNTDKITIASYMRNNQVYPLHRKLQ